MSPTGREPEEPLKPIDQERIEREEKERMAAWEREPARNQEEHERDARDRDSQHDKQLREIEAEAARDRAERADPGTRGMVEARDHHAAGGRFDDADSTQRLIDATARRSAERAERREREDRETGPDADWATRTAEKGRQFAHPIELPPPERTPGDAATDRTHSRASGVDWTPTRDWDGRPDRGQGRTRDRAHWRGDRPGPSYADRNRGRSEEQQR